MARQGVTFPAVSEVMISRGPPDAAGIQQVVQYCSQSLTTVSREHWGPGAEVGNVSDGVHLGLP